MPSFTVFKGSKDGIKKAESHRPELSGDQILVKVTASGLCGTGTSRGAGIEATREKSSYH